MQTKEPINSPEPIHVLSLGAGVQSSTLALMASIGVITPKPAFSVFADTKAEPLSVYLYLSYLCGCTIKYDESNRPYVDPGTYSAGVLTFPVIIVTKGNLEDLSTVVIKAKGRAWTRHSIPAFAYTSQGERKGPIMRQCTRDMKIREIVKALNRIRRDAVKDKLPIKVLKWIGKKIKKQKAVMVKPKLPGIIQWIGISYDEIYRMKEARDKWCQNRWPLVELKLTREDCRRWITEHKFRMPPRSACFFCPYHSDAEWLRLKTQEPDEFDRAVAYEVKFQNAVEQCTGYESTVFLHTSGKPLDQVEFSKHKGQLNLFNNECEGMCGV